MYCHSSSPVALPNEFFLISYSNLETVYSKREESPNIKVAPRRRRGGSIKEGEGKERSKEKGFLKWTAR